MRKLPIFFAALSLAATVAFAQQQSAPKREPSPKQAAQQQKMRDCNAMAKERELKGEERRAFMSQCLSKAGLTMTNDDPVVPTK